MRVSTQDDGVMWRDLSAGLERLSLNFQLHMAACLQHHPPSPIQTRLHSVLSNLKGERSYTRVHGRSHMTSAVIIIKDRHAHGMEDDGMAFSRSPEGTGQQRNFASLSGTQDESSGCSPQPCVLIYVSIVLRPRPEVNVTCLSQSPLTVLFEIWSLTALGAH